MAKPNKIQNIIDKLGELKYDGKTAAFEGEMNGLGSKLVEEQLAGISKNLRDSASIKSLDKIAEQLINLKKEMDMTPIKDSISEIDVALNSKITQLTGELQAKLEEAHTASEQHKSEVGTTISTHASTLLKQLFQIKAELTAKSDSLGEGQVFLKEQIRKEIKNEVGGLETKLNSLISGLRGDLTNADGTVQENATKSFKDLEDKIEKLRKDFIERFSRISNLGGGQANRNISIGGNSSVLSKYGDINLKAGANTTITYANNNATQNLDITITATGGAGGITRSIVSVSTPTNAGATAGTDYVYLVSGTTAVTLPTAVGNSNLYTIKNVGSGTVTVATTSAQTIDGSATITMPVQYTSVDLTSDGTNWNVT